MWVKTQTMCLYRLDKAIQVLHLKRVWVHVVKVLKLFQQGLVVQCAPWIDRNEEVKYE